MSWIITFTGRTSMSNSSRNDSVTSSRLSHLTFGFLKKKYLVLMTNLSLAIMPEPLKRYFNDNDAIVVLTFLRTNWFTHQLRQRRLGRNPRNFVLCPL